MANDLDSLFQAAVNAIDEGDILLLRKLLDDHPQLATDRLVKPGQWLLDDIGPALDSFFKDPYLLWFVSEDAPRRNKLPANIVDLAIIIIKKAKSVTVKSVPEQVDYALRLVAWSPVARKCKVQLPLIKLLVDEGAKMDGVPDDALVNGNSEAAKYLIQLGATMTLATAFCLGDWDRAAQLAATSTGSERQFSLVLSALNGNAEAVARIIGYGGITIDRPSPHLYSHATALHHAVWSCSLDTVKCLINAGARTDIRDTIYNGTPLDWAVHAGSKEIEKYLRQLSHS